MISLHLVGVQGAVSDCHIFVHIKDTVHIERSLDRESLKVIWNGARLVPTNECDF
jgi:hypothetical protein